MKCDVTHYSLAVKVWSKQPLGRKRISRNVYIHTENGREIDRKTETERGRSAGDIVEPIGVLGSVIEEIRVKMERQWLI